MRLTPDLAERFGNSLICNCSLSSRELFHSNFLAWIVKTHGPALIERLTGFSDIRVKEVHRERHHYDVTIETLSGDIVIENKVKSLPRRDQLERYLAEIDQTRDHLVLLSLAKPSVDVTESLPQVKFVNYEDLRTALDAIKPQSEYWAEAINDYRLLLDVLLAVEDDARIDDWSTRLHFDSEYATRLRKIRLHDLAQKLRFAAAVAILAPLISGRNSRTVCRTNVDFTRGQALLEFRWHVDADLWIGIQAQGKQYRRFVVSENKGDVSMAAEKLEGSGLWVTGSNRGGGLLQFGREFRYRYSPLGKLTVADFRDRLSEDTQKLYSKWDAIRAALA